MAKGYLATVAALTLAAGAEIASAGAGLGVRPADLKPVDSEPSREESKKREEPPHHRPDSASDVDLFRCRAIETVSDLVRLALLQRFQYRPASDRTSYLQGACECLVKCSHAARPMGLSDKSVFLDGNAERCVGEEELKLSGYTTHAELRPSEEVCRDDSAWKRQLNDVRTDVGKLNSERMKNEPVVNSHAVSIYKPTPQPHARKDALMERARYAATHSDCTGFDDLLKQFDKAHREVLVRGASASDRGEIDRLCDRTRIKKR